jgi:ribose transport system ATP-binding protein/rhamnose transport system ATP-binding protein
LVTGLESAATSAARPVLSVEGISKTFSGVKALSRVSLEVRTGEIHAVVGENGAGKSTLMKIIYGLETPDEGRLILEGAIADLSHDDGRGRPGVGMVHQERSLVPTLSVAENVFAGRQHTGAFGLIRGRAMVAATQAIFDRLHEQIDPQARVGALSPARQQIVEIAKALAGDPKVLILDEPTAALTLNETGRLFEVLRKLKARGVAIIYISHRLAEVFQIADRVTVLKDGAVTGQLPVSEVNENRLIQLMVGRELSFARSAGRPAQDAAVALELRGLASAPEVVEATFSVRRGEIVCLAGLIGAGRSEMCEAIFGIRPITGGELWIEGRKSVVRDSAQACALGLALVPEERKESGLFVDFSVLDNILSANLGRVASRGMVVARKARDLATSVVKRLGVVTAGIDQTVGDLSGGNQQKLLLGRWLATDPRILIVDEPTRGVDVGARAQIYELLRDLARGGLAIVVVSSDLLEVLTLAHRIVVFREGRTVGELDGATATEEQVMRLAAVEVRERVVA